MKPVKLLTFFEFTRFHFLLPVTILSLFEGASSSWKNGFGKEDCKRCLVSFLFYTRNTNRIANMNGVHIMKKCRKNRKVLIIANVCGLAQRPGPLLFNAGCNEQVFSSKPSKKIGADLSCRF